MIPPEIFKSGKKIDLDLLFERFPSKRIILLPNATPIGLYELRGYLFALPMVPPYPTYNSTRSKKTIFK
jgi:hypothetical protein